MSQQVLSYAFNKLHRWKVLLFLFFWIRVQTLQQQLIQSNQNLAQYHNNGIKEFLLGNYIEEEDQENQDAYEKYPFHSSKDNHCLNQETKRLRVNLLFLWIFWWKYSYQLLISEKMWGFAKGSVILPKEVCLTINCSERPQRRNAENTWKASGWLFQNVKSVTRWL